MAEPNHPVEQKDHAQEERDRQVTNIFLLVFFLVVVGGGIWLANAMVEQRTIDNCIAQGRRNCAPIETSVR
jgi:hypothetical protein